MTKEEELLALRMIDEEQRLRAIHEMRWKLLEIRDSLNNNEIYIEANELLNGIERNIWKLIKTGKYNG